jgi:hypothetical protein
MSQRVVFTFDEGSLNTLKQVKEKGDFSSLGTAVRESVQVSDVLQDLVSGGFTELVVRNPKTSQEKTIVIGSLQRLAKTAGNI